MRHGDSADGTKLAGSADGEDGNVGLAAARLAQEARQAVSYGARGVRDISDEFANAAKELQTGQLVIDEFFTLFESVGAVEIMDGKMDSGYVPPDNKFEPDFDPCAGIEAAGVLWIIDEILCLEIAWHDGYPLSQTVFTSVHLDRLLSPDNRYPYTFNYGESAGMRTGAKHALTHTVLRAYCIAVAKCCHMVLEVVKSQTFYEEEDFVTHQFGRELLPRIDWHEADRLLSDALEWLAGADFPGDIRTALELRLRFRQSLMLSIFAETSDWDGMGNTIERLKETHGLGKPTVAAFTDKVQRQLATSTPPRPMPQISWDDVCTKWTRLCADIAEADRLTSLWVRQSPHYLQRAAWAFVHRDPQPATYVRAVFQDLLFAEGKVAGDIPHYDLLLQDIEDLVLAGDVLADPESFQIELPSDPRHICSRLIEGFMDKALDEYLNLYRMVCQNRCRIRRTFTQALPLWNEIELSLAAETDRHIYNALSRRKLDTPLGKQVCLNPLTSWARYHKLKLMEDTVHLGFETDIYLPDETGQMYWFLLRLTNERTRLLEHIGVFLHDRTVQLSKMRNARYFADAQVSQDWIHSLKVGGSCTISVAAALWRLYSLLLMLQLIESPKRPFATEQLLYEARMKPYFPVTDPCPPDAAAFMDAKYLTGPLSGIFLEIDEDVKGAKQSLTALKEMTPQQAKYIGTEDRWKQEIKRLETTCVAIAVAVTQLRRACDKHAIKEVSGEGDGSLKRVMSVGIPPPGKRYHAWWVVPQLKEVR